MSHYVSFQMTVDGSQPESIGTVSVAPNVDRVCVKEFNLLADPIPVSTDPCIQEVSVSKTGPNAEVKIKIGNAGSANNRQADIILAVFDTGS